MSSSTPYMPTLQTQTPPQSQTDQTPPIFTPTQAQSLIATTTTTFLATYLATNNHPPPHCYRPTPQTLALAANAFLNLTEQPLEQPLPTIHPIFINPHHLFHLIIYALTFLPLPPTYSSQRVFLEAVMTELGRRNQKRMVAMVPVWERMVEGQTGSRREVVPLHRMFEVGMDLTEGGFVACDTARAAVVLPEASGEEQMFVSWGEVGNESMRGVVGTETEDVDVPTLVGKLERW